MNRGDAAIDESKVHPESGVSGTVRAASNVHAASNVRVASDVRVASNVRVAMIGAGSMSNMVHYPSLASFDDVEIAAICDIDTQRLHATADRYGVDRRYVDYRKMIEEVAPDAVYAIGQPHIFYDI